MRDAGVVVQPRPIFPLGQKHAFVAEALWRCGSLPHWLFHKRVLGSVRRLTKEGETFERHAALPICAMAALLVIDIPKLTATTCGQNREAQIQNRNTAWYRLGRRNFP